MKPERPAKTGEYMEMLYNQHSICEALLCDGLSGASALFKERIRRVCAQAGGTIPEVDGMIIITSLNRCLYDFFQFYMHVSLTDCCFRNRVHAGSMHSDGDVLSIGLRVLNDYHAAFTARQEACSHLEKARVYIREHLADTLTLQTVGRAIHISSGYVSRIFSSLAGQTFADYVREERVAFSRRLLAQTTLPIDTIAGQCGFNTPNYFATVFKHYMGISPQAYRREQSVPAAAPGQAGRKTQDSAKEAAD